MAFKIIAQKAKKITIGEGDGALQLRIRFPSTEMRSQIMAQCVTALTSTNSVPNTNDYARNLSRWMVVGWEDIERPDGNLIVCPKDPEDANEKWIEEIWPHMDDAVHVDLMIKANDVQIEQVKRRSAVGKTLDDSSNSNSEDSPTTQNETPSPTPKKARAKKSTKQSDDED